MIHNQMPGESNLCSDLIYIPPELPGMLKAYCKAAIRTQPYDLLRWSAVYFRAIACGKAPPVKERLEFPPSESPPALTFGYIKLMINLLGKSNDLVVSVRRVAHIWSDLSLPRATFDALLTLMDSTRFPFLRFVAVATGSLSISLTHTMETLCELLTDDNDDGPACIPFAIFMDLYEFLAYLDCGPDIQFVVSGEKYNHRVNGNNSNNTYLQNKDNSVFLTAEDDMEMDDGVGGGGSGATNEAVVVVGENSEESLAVRGEDNMEKLTTFFTQSRPNKLYYRGIGPALDKDQVERVYDFLKFWSDQQSGMVMPRNLKHSKCPSLDPFYSHEKRQPYSCERKD